MRKFKDYFTISGVPNLSLLLMPPTKIWRRYQYVISPVCRWMSKVYPCQFSRRYHLQQEIYKGGCRTFWPSLVLDQKVHFMTIIMVKEKTLSGKNISNSHGQQLYNFIITYNGIFSFRSLEWMRPGDRWLPPVCGMYWHLWWVYLPVYVRLWGYLQNTWTRLRHTWVKIV